MLTGSSPAVNFGSVNLCAAGKTAPEPCSTTVALSYKVTEGGTLGAIKVVTGGTPDLDFALASGSTCTGEVHAGTICQVKVAFTPEFAGTRQGGVLITDATGSVLVSTLLYGTGIGPQAGTQTNAVSKILTSAAAQLPPVQGVLDGAGDIFVANDAATGGAVTEKLAGGGPTITLPFLGLNYPSTVAVDGLGDVFVIADNEIFGSQVVMKLPAGCESSECVSSVISGFIIEGIAADASGDLFVLYAPVQNDSDSEEIVKLPAGGGAQITLAQLPIGATGTDFYSGLAVDGLGNLFTIAGDYPNPAVTLDELPGGSSTLVVVQPNVVGSNVESGSNYTDLAVASDFSGDLFATNTQGSIYDGEVGTSTIEYQTFQFAPLNFGSILFGTTSILPVNVVNTGNRSLTITPVLDNASYTVLSAAPEGCLTATAVRQSCTLQVEFSPATVGPHNGSLTLETNGATNQIVVLEGNAGVPAPVFSLTPGVYGSAQTVSITDSSAGAAVYYTTNGATPTAASSHYTGPISVSSTETVTAIAILGGAPSAITTGTYTIVTGVLAQIDDFSEGFAASKGPIQFNGSTTLDGSRLQLTSINGYDDAASAFYTSRVNIQSFATDFTFQLTDAVADGFTFAIQNVSDKEVGGYGGKLGYEGIGKSVAIKFDLANNAGEGPNSTGLYVNGAYPTAPSIDLTGTGINLHSGDAILAQITYNSSTLTLTLTDAITLATWTHSFTVDIPAIVGGNTAFVGFTAGVGGENATQEILSWTYVAGTIGAAPPAAPLPPVPQYSAGFNLVGLRTNGSAAIAGASLQLTNGGYVEAGSAFYGKPLNVQAFTTDFSFQLINPGMSLASMADGFTFTVQDAGLNAIGPYGGSLGYATIGKSVAIKFDLHNTSGEGDNSTGLYINGAPPTVPAIDLSNTGIDLHGGHPFAAHVTYDGTTLVLTLTDKITLAAWSHSFAVNIPATVGSNMALVGFTAGSGGSSAIQNVLSWTFSNP